MTDRGCILDNETLQTLCPRLICLEDPCGAAAAELLARLRETALQRGVNLFGSPLSAFDLCGKIAALL